MVLNPGLALWIRRLLDKVGDGSIQLFQILGHFLSHISDMAVR